MDRMADDVTLLSRFGFSFERNSAHTARTLMLTELSALFDAVDDPSAARSDYQQAVIADNCLLKRSHRNRELSWKHLAELYACDPDRLLFRALRFFWQRDPAGRPLLALLCAYARDPLLRVSAPLILALPAGASAAAEPLTARLEELTAGRFSPATLRSLVQNLRSTWTQSGHLYGLVRKVRQQVPATSASLAYALLLGYLRGLRGPALLQSEYTQLLDCSYESSLELAQEAAGRGWLIFKRVADVVEVTFPTLLRVDEAEWLREQNQSPA
jgi:hypothetical protein